MPRSPSGCAARSRLRVHLVDPLLDAIDGQIAVLDPSGQILRANRAWRTSTVPGALVFPPGSDYLAGLTAAGSSDLARRLGELLRSPEGAPGFSTEYGAESRWFRLTARPHAGGVVLHHEDVTANRRAIAALQASEARVAAIVEHTPNVAIQAYDRQGHVLRWNRASERMYGWSEAEARGRTLDQLILTPQEMAVFLAAIEAVERTGAPVEPYTWEFRKKNGSTGFGYSTVFAVPAPGGAHEYICMDVDITALHHGEAAQQRMVALLEATTDYVAITDLEARPLYLNRALRQALGLAEGQLPEFLRLEQVYPAETANYLRTVGFPKAIQEGSWSGEATFVGADDVPRPTSQVVLSHRDAKGQVEFVSTTARDLTAQKALEAQLLQSQKMEGIGRLAGGIAHDFNNVLTAIVGAAELARYSLPRDHAAQSGLSMIVKATGRANALTRQLLTFARKQASQPKVVRIDRLIADTEQLLRRLIGEDIELVTTTATERPAVRVDPGHFEQLLINLVVNARDAMPRGGRLMIATELVRTRGEAPDHVRLTVSDTGTGMSDDVLAHLFEPFFTTKEPGRGTGLGLATCYGIVKQAGGNIRAESVVGLGSTFVVELPLALEPVPDEPRPTPTPTPPSGGHETLLLAEDEAIVRELAVRVLRDAGYRVLTAARGDEALATARHHTAPIDLLVTDVVMPGMNGRELAHAMLADRPSLAVLYMSGYAEELTAPHGVLPRGREFLAKPFTPQELVARVRELLDRVGTRPT
jgi:two-component system cell cycle sensor histidine kinase/response regulator CckA